MIAIFKGRTIPIQPFQNFCDASQLSYQIEDYYYKKKSKSSNENDFKNSIFLNYLYVSLIRNYFISTLNLNIPRDTLQIKSSEYLEKLKRNQLQYVSEDINPSAIQNSYNNYSNDPLDAFYQLAYTNYSNDYLIAIIKENPDVFNKNFLKNKIDTRECLNIYEETFVGIFGQGFEKFERKIKNNFSSSASKKEGCYIATAIYGDYNAPEVIILRRFRDEILKKNKIGNFLIEVYYKYSPKIADNMKDKTKLNSFIRLFLDKFVSILNKKVIKKI